MAHYSHQSRFMAIVKSEKGCSFRHDLECELVVNVQRTAFLMTKCNQEPFGFAASFSRRMVAESPSERINRVGGAPLWRQVNRWIGLLGRFAEIVFWTSVIRRSLGILTKTPSRLFR